VRQRIPGRRIVDVPIASGQGRHLHRVGDTLGLPDAFVVSKEKRAILDDRAADGAAKLVALERRLRGAATLKEILCIQRAVAQEVLHAAMKCIRPGARNGINNAPGSLAVFRGIVAREDGELLDGVDAEVAAENAARRSVGVVV